MKFRKAIKKIAALGLGASLVGATIMGAAAADLNDFPAPFVSGGKFSGTMVVGDNAAAEDVVGVSDIAMSLQYASAVKTSSSGAASTTTVEGDAYKFEKASNKLNLYQDIGTGTYSIKTTLTSSDLNALADGTFTGKTTESFTQTIKPANETTRVVWDDYNDINEEPAIYLKFTAPQKVFEYKLNFGTAATSDIDTSTSTATLEDFENNKISILGSEYTVTKAENLSQGIRLTLMAGAVQDTLEVGQTKTYTINGKDYEVTVMVVSGDAAATALAKLIVNDEVTKSLSKDQTITLKDGLDLGIKEVLPTKSGDAIQNLVEFYLGAQKLVLDGNDGSVDIGDNSNVEDTTVTITNTMSGTTENKLNSIVLKWEPSSTIYVPVGGTVKESLEIEEETDGVQLLDKLGIDYKFAGVVTGATEEVYLGRESDNSIKMKFTNKNGVEYDFPLFKYEDSIIKLGKEADKDLYHMEGDDVCDEDMFLVESDKYTRVLQLKDIKNSSDSKYIKVKDIGTGDTTSYDWPTSTATADLNIDGYTYQLKVINATCVDLTEATDDGDGDVDIWTKYGSSFNITDSDDINLGVGQPHENLSYYNLVMFEDSDKQEDDSTIDYFAWNFSYEPSKTNIDFAGDIMEPVATELSMLTLDSDTKKSQGYSKWGTFFERDTNADQDTWTITIPENELQAEVFMTAGVTTVATSEAATGDAVILNKIDVGATKLASEVAGLETSQNLILVGGPCANAAVEAASDMFPTCAGWSYQPGEGIIQIVEQDNGNVALLVAGTNAADTRTATGVVADMTKLTELADGVTKQLVTVVSGQEVLTDVPEVEVVEEEAPAAEDETMETEGDAAEGGETTE